MNSIFNYLQNNTSINVLPDQSLNNQWQHLTMNRTTLSAFMKVQQQNENNSADKSESYLEKYINSSTEKLGETEETEQTEKPADTKTEEALADKNAKDNVNGKEKEENYLQKFLRQSTEKLSKPNKELQTISNSISNLTSISTHTNATPATISRTPFYYRNFGTVLP